jgi:hypothetical protein
MFTHGSTGDFEFSNHLQDVKYQVQVPGVEEPAGGCISSEVQLGSHAIRVIGPQDVVGAWGRGKGYAVWCEVDAVATWLLIENTYATAEHAPTPDPGSHAKCCATCKPQLAVLWRCQESITSTQQHLLPHLLSGLTSAHSSDWLTCGQDHECLKAEADAQHREVAACIILCQREVQHTLRCVEKHVSCSSTAQRSIARRQHVGALLAKAETPSHVLQDTLRTASAGCLM